jgi:hypothetical protein
MLSIPGHKRNANQNHIKIPPHSLEGLSSRTQIATNTDVDMEEKGTLKHCWRECKLVQPL